MRTDLVRASGAIACLSIGLWLGGADSFAQEPEPVGPVAAPVRGQTNVADDASLGEPARPGENSPTLGPSDATFGPVVVVERIDVVGNRSTAESVIRNALPVRVGQTMRAGDPRLAEAKYRVLALGYFTSVEMTLKRGSRRGSVVVEVEVAERGTITLEQFFLGTTEITPWWFGADLSERNFLGTGISVGAAFIGTARTRVDGGQHQKAMQLRLGKAALGDSRLGLELSSYLVDASEPYRVRGAFDDGGRENFDHFEHRRIGSQAAGTWTLNAWQRLSVAGRFEHVHTERPLAAVQTDPDGSIHAIDFHLRPGDTRVATLSVIYDRDTRSEPVLTTSGDHLRIRGEVGSELLGGSYEYGSIFAKYQRWWPIFNQHHVLSLHLTGGVVVGDAPRFDRMYVGDLNRWLTPRLLGLVVSTKPARYVSSNEEHETYGDLGGVLVGEYAYQIYKGKRLVYGGNLFFGLGLWTLTRGERVRARDEDLTHVLPLGFFADAGIRLDTEVGIFELSLANAIGRVAYE